MTDLIPQDLIQFVEANRPAVLPDILMVVNLHAKTRLQSECEKIIFLRNKLDGSHYRISDDHAAALLANWLDEELGKCATYKYETLQYAQTGVWAVFVDGDVKATSDNKLSALWQAYKKVKGIKE